MDYLAGMHGELMALLDSGEAPGPGMRLEVDDERMRLTRAAIAYAHHLWRTPIEEWHCTRRGPDDGEMMRINAAVVRLIRQGLADGLSWTAVRADVLDPGRTLPDGRTLLAALGRTRLDRIGRRSRVHGMFDDYQARFGRAETLMLASLTYMGFGSDWHGMPDFEEIVDCFAVAVDNPGVKHWDTRKESPARWPLPPRPAQIADTAQLRTLLLAGPDLLDAESARWCMIAGIRYSNRAWLEPSTQFAPDGSPLTPG